MRLLDLAQCIKLTYREKSNLDNQKFNQIYKVSENHAYYGINRVDDLGFISDGMRVVNMLKLNIIVAD